jgi:hypothetical protein
MSEEQDHAFQALRPAQSCRVIDFNTAQVIMAKSAPPGNVLIVSGEKPYLNMDVSLIPLVYIQQPDYWGIEVVGCLPQIGLPATAPYVVQLDLAGTIGTHGIEVMGATRSEKIDIPAKPQGSYTLSITLADSGQLIAEATLICPPNDENGGSHPNPAAACEQLTQADGRIEAVPEDSGPCTREHNPVIVTATGTWNGEPRHYKQEFSNRCIAVRATGGVIFDL